MKYTKEELLGAIFKWDYEYIVIENGDDVQLKNISIGNLYPAYNLEYLNSYCLEYLDVSSLSNKIPSKWCIKCTSETYDDISKWFNNKLKRKSYDPDKINYWHFPEIRAGVCTSSIRQVDYKEITFEFFKRVILKEEVINKNMSYITKILEEYGIT